MAMVTITQAETVEAFRARGLEARSRVSEGCVQMPDGSYGPIVKSYSVEVTLRDDKSGNTVLRTLRLGESSVGEVDVDAVEADIRLEMKRRVKETKARLRAERSSGRS